jgi:hypothetical protein
MRIGYNFREGPENGQVNGLKFTHIITNKRFGTTIKVQRKEVKNTTGLYL